MKGLLASYRWRRRLLWLAALAVIAAGVAALVITVPNGTVAEESPVSNERVPVSDAYRTPKSVRLRGAARTSALSVARDFIRTAIARRHVDRSWDLAAPALRRGFTRKEWSRGDIPVAPYPVGQARWTVDYSYRDSVGLQIALFPRHGARLRPQVFLLDLKAFGAGEHRHWLVKSWNPTPIDMTGARTSAPGTVLDAVSPRVEPVPGGGRLSATWLLVPVGFLSLVILIPAAYLLLNWYRGSRGDRTYLREHRARYSSSSRPS